MIITLAEFDHKLEAGDLALTLVGMSGVGKSFWSERIAQEGRFTHVCCDARIEAEVEDVLEGLGYSGGIQDMARWLGQPYDPQFPENQRKYLDLEIATMQDIIDQRREGLSIRNTIIDTTGSVVHTSREICERLRALTTVVYLEATPDMKDEMFERYMAEPKPVVWGNTYCPRDNEQPIETLARCYHDLLAQRSELYAAMAHITLPAEVARYNIPDTNSFLEYVRSSLPT